MNEYFGYLLFIFIFHYKFQKSLSCLLFLFLLITNTKLLTKNIDEKTAKRKYHSPKTKLIKKLEFFFSFLFHVFLQER